VMVHARSARWEQKPSYECLLIGCGWGTSLHRKILLPRLLARASRGVIDADGVNLLAQRSPRKLGSNWVLTPHIGELARLVNRSTGEVGHDLIGAACEAAALWGCIVVAKSHVLSIANPDGRHVVVDGMNAAMGTGGTGDVLAGVIAGLLANGLGGMDAAVCGVGLHQQAGQVLRPVNGFFAANQLIGELQRLSDRSSG
jgi:ADP-dependent NAD(P)H-hydrate dehydratase / NAD(P)H-hydrate epimerase